MIMKDRCDNNKFSLFLCYLYRCTSCVSVHVSYLDKLVYAKLVRVVVLLDKASNVLLLHSRQFVHSSLSLQAAALLQGGQPVTYCSRAMSPAETWYAQIEKELLAIVFAVERFEPYVYDHDKVMVESDHKPHQFIFHKRLLVVPKHLQRMLLRLQKHSLHVFYKRGKELSLADRLSRVYLPEINACDLIPELDEIDHKQYLAVCEERLQQINHASAKDPVLQQQRTTICSGWPESKPDLPETLYPYYDHRDTLFRTNLCSKVSI